jgi:hypothetical protein
MINGGLMCVGGPRVEVVVNVCLAILLICLLLSALGSPPRHSVVVAVAVAAAAFLPFLILFLDNFISQHPSIMFIHVA